MQKESVYDKMTRSEKEVAQLLKNLGSYSKACNKNVHKNDPGETLIEASFKYFSNT